LVIKKFTNEKKFSFISFYIVASREKKTFVTSTGLVKLVTMRNPSSEDILRVLRAMGLPCGLAPKAWLPAKIPELARGNPTLRNF
jgi:hypothetical protein